MTSEQTIADYISKMIGKPILPENVTPYRKAVGLPARVDEIDPETTTGTKRLLYFGNIFATRNVFYFDNAEVAIYDEDDNRLWRFSGEVQPGSAFAPGLSQVQLYDVVFARLSVTNIRNEVNTQAYFVGYKIQITT